MYKQKLGILGLFAACWVTPFLEKTGENTSLAAKGALAHRLQCHTNAKIQNGHQGAPK